MMLALARPINEPQRLDTLRALKVFDSAPEERFDRLTSLAKRLFGRFGRRCTPPRMGAKYHQDKPGLTR